MLLFTWSSEDCCEPHLFIILLLDVWTPKVIACFSPPGNRIEQLLKSDLCNIGTWQVLHGNKIYFRKSFNNAATYIHIQITMNGKHQLRPPPKKKEWILRAKSTDYYTEWNEPGVKLQKDPWHIGFSNDTSPPRPPDSPNSHMCSNWLDLIRCQPTE